MRHALLQALCNDKFATMHLLAVNIATSPVYRMRNLWD